MADAGFTRTPTPGQTIGPFFHYALPYDGDSELVPVGSPGSVRLHGYVYDGAGEPVPDALLEIRQSDRGGIVPRVEGSLRRQGGAFTGWGRSHTDRTGHYWFSTIEPGPVEPDGSAFFAVTIFARGLLDRLFTRAYLPESPTDALQRSLSDDLGRRLLTEREPDGDLRFDLHLQGERESVFLAFPRHPL